MDVKQLFLGYYPVSYNNISRIYLPKDIVDVLTYRNGDAKKPLKARLTRRRSHRFIAYFDTYELSHQGENFAKGFEDANIMGRNLLSIPETIAAQLSLEDSLVILGAGKHFELWNRDEADKEIARILSSHGYTGWLNQRRRHQ